MHKHVCEMISSNPGDENSEQISEWSLHIHITIDAYRTEKTRLNLSNHRIGINVFLSYVGLAGQGKSCKHDYTLYRERRLSDKDILANNIYECSFKPPA